jgi:hypothetical protein
MTIRDVVSASGTFAANNGTSKQKRFSFLYDMDIISIIFWTGNTISFLTFRGGENTFMILRNLLYLIGIKFGTSIINLLSNGIFIWSPPQKWT